MPRKQHKHHFIYKTTCLVNMKYYVGMHSTSNLEDGYIGSGRKLWLSIRKHGRENFKFEILESFPDRDSLKARERELVNEVLLKDPLCMNLKIGGEGGRQGDWELHLKISKMGSSAWGKKSPFSGHFEKLKSDPEYRKNYSESMKNVQNFKGKFHTEEYKERKSQFMKESQKGEKNSQFGTCFINKDGKNLRIKKELLEQYLTDGWVKGRKGRH